MLTLGLGGLYMHKVHQSLINKAQSSLTPIPNSDDLAGFAPPQPDILPRFRRPVFEEFHAASYDNQGFLVETWRRLLRNPFGPRWDILDPPGPNGERLYSQVSDQHLDFLFRVKEHVLVYAHTLSNAARYTRPDDITYADKIVLNSDVHYFIKNFTFFRDWSNGPTGLSGIPGFFELVFHQSVLLNAADHASHLAHMIM